MDENEEFEFRLRAEREAGAAPPVPAAAPPAAPAAPAAPAPARGLPGVALPAAEIALQGTTSLLSSVPGAVAYGATAVGNALGLSDTKPRDAMSATKDYFTYRPQSQAAQDIGRSGDEAIGKVVAPIMSAADRAATAVGKVSPTAEELLREAPSAAEAAGVLAPVAGAARSAMGAAARGAKPKAVVEGAAKPNPDDPIQMMRSAGIKLRPTDVKSLKPGEKVPGTRRESLQGPAELRKDFTLDNQAVVTKLAAEELGLKRTDRLARSDFDKLREPHFKTYEQTGQKAGKFAPSEEFRAFVGGLDDTTPASTVKELGKFGGSVDGAEAIKSISRLRSQALRDARSADRATRDAGEATRAAADALEEELGRRLTGVGEAAQVQAFNDARTTLAKIHDVQTATRGGQIDPAALFRMDQKNPGRMSGRLKMIADAHGAAPNVVRHSRGATGAGSSVKAEGVFSALKSAAGKAVSRLPGMDVTRANFQNRFGREATDNERAMFADYGVKPQGPALAAPPGPQLGTGSVDFSPTAPVTPPLASRMAGDLQLAPDPVANPQQLPDAPDMLTADVIPPFAGGQDAVDFTPSPELMQNLATELGLAPRPGDGAPYDLEWSPPTMAPQMAADVSLTPGNVPLDLMPDLAQQLGLVVDTPQPIDFGKPAGVRGVENPYMDDFAGLDEAPGAVGAQPGNLPVDAPVPPVEIEQLGFSLGEALGLEAPPGQLGPRPVPQVGAAPTPDTSLAELLGIGPLEPPPKPRKSRK